MWADHISFAFSSSSILNRTLCERVCFLLIASSILSCCGSLLSAAAVLSLLLLRETTADNRCVNTLFIFIFFIIFFLVFSFELLLNTLIVLRFLNRPYSPSQPTHSNRLARLRRSRSPLPSFACCFVCSSTTIVSRLVRSFRCIPEVCVCVFAHIGQFAFEPLSDAGKSKPTEDSAHRHLAIGCSRSVFGRRKSPQTCRRPLHRGQRPQTGLQLQNRRHSKSPLNCCADLFPQVIRLHIVVPCSIIVRFVSISLQITFNVCLWRVFACLLFMLFNDFRKFFSCLFDFSIQNPSSY